MLRVLFRLAVVPLGLAVALLAGGPAFADCHGDGVNSGSGRKYVGAGTQFWEWSLANGESTTTSQSYSGMSYDLCLESRFDWETQSGHYDARATRMCGKPYSYGGVVGEPLSWGGRDVTGLQKAAGCKYLQTSPPASSPPDYGDCEYDSDSETGCPFAANSAQAWNEKNHAVFLLRQDGTVEQNDGGVVSDPDN